MKKLISSFLFLLLAVTATTAQDINFNQYKYVIVNSKFDFVRQVDGFRTSSLTKFLFNKMGFIAVMDNEELDDELAVNRCSAIYADVKDDSGMLTTKNYIEIKDCKGRLLFTSLTGSSRSKQYEKAYRQAIKEAFQSIEKIGYNYDPTLAKKEAFSKVKKEKVKETKPVKVAKPTKDKKAPLMVTQEVTVKETTPVKTVVKKDIQKNTIIKLYAQPNANGYQLVNTKPEIVFVLLKTNTADKFFIKDKNGTFVKDGDYWLAEYYDNGKLIVQKYEVKF
jgi:hypothetical protein